MQLSPNHCFEQKKNSSLDNIILGWSSCTKKVLWVAGSFCLQLNPGIVNPRDFHKVAYYTTVPAKRSSLFISANQER